MYYTYMYIYPVEKKHQYLNVRFYQMGSSGREITFFESLYRDYFSRTLFFAHQYLPDIEEAQEIAQETFITLWEKRGDLRPDLNIQAFILTIAKNKCLNVLRKKISEQKYSRELTAREMMANYSALSDDTFDALQMQELKALIDQTEGDLPEKTRRIYQMSRDQDMSYEEIAGQIGLSVKSVEYHITKALAYFRRQLKDYITLIFLISLRFLP